VTKNLKAHIILEITLIISVGIFLVSIISYNTYSNLFNDGIKNNTNLDTLILKKVFYIQFINDVLLFIFLGIIAVLLISIIIKNYENKLTIFAEKDQLTGIPNRRVFDRYLEKAIHIAYLKKSSFVVLIFDIDNFKHINDTYGHILGDIIIKKISILISNILKEPDFIARWGGDEFSGIIFDSNMALEVIEKIKVSIGDDFELSKYKVTVSMGITYYREKDSVTSIVRRADQALYMSKKNGKNKLIGN
jgi:diguanylate cyclase (GGDEF)-like protein